MICLVASELVCNDLSNENNPKHSDFRKTHRKIPIDNFNCTLKELSLILIRTSFVYGHNNKEDS